MEKLYIVAKNFLENFSLDYDKLKGDLKKVMSADFETLGLDKTMEVSFEESELFGKSGSVSKTEIAFNKTRIEMLYALKIDDAEEGHLKKVESFYSHYDESTQHTGFEQNLYNFIKRYKEMGADWAFECMGSYKRVKYELLDAILHETEHVYQNEFKEKLDADNFPQDTRGKVLVFTALFDRMFKKLQNNDIKLEYDRKNHIFPIEFDARYESLRQLNEIKERFFKDDKDFAEHLIKSNIIPKDFDAEQTSKRIFADYEKVYELYAQNFGDEFGAANRFVEESKNQIISELIRRYGEMTEISSRQKSSENLSLGRA